MKIALLILLMGMAWGQDTIQNNCEYIYEDPGVEIDWCDIVTDCLLKKYAEYAKECYADSSFKSYNTSFVLDDRVSVEDEIKMFYKDSGFIAHYCQDCITWGGKKGGWTIGYFIHKQPTFPGFMKWLKRRMED